jgi:hypothetical protein
MKKQTISGTDGNSLFGKFLPQMNAHTKDEKVSADLWECIIEDETDLQSWYGVIVVQGEERFISLN